MTSTRDPQWLQTISRKLRWLTIPNLAGTFVAAQGIGFLLAMANPESLGKLALIPEMVLRGEIWRLVSFLALPLTMNLLGLLFGLMFGYFILNSIENEWGSTKTTIYVLSSLVLTAAFSLVFDYPILTVTGFVSTWFLAAATLFPEQTINIYFVFPVKLKWLGWVAAIFVLLEFFKGGWIDRLYLLTLYANYFLFFGPALLYSVQQAKRRRDYKNQFRR